MKITALINVLLTTVLLSSIFSISIKSSASNSEITALDPYDPWRDLNDDGSIDILDAIYFCRAFDTQGTPINKTGLLLQLQAKIDILEGRINQSRTLRFFEPNETFTHGPDTIAATFDWIPINSSSNAILGGVVYFEWKGFLTGPPQIDYADFGYTLNINGYEVGWVNRLQWSDQPDYIWIPELPIRVSHEANFKRYGVTPNQASYSLTFRIGNAGFADMYVRNINVIITVIDGLPAN